MTTADFRITGIALHGRHGARPEERTLGQHFKLDLDITADIGAAETSDALDDTLHYGQVVKAAMHVFNERPYNLIEAVAGAIADVLMRDFPKIQRVRVTVHKPSAPIAAIFDDLSASLERRR
jgi:dihydroneopterin aldolase